MLLSYLLAYLYNNNNERICGMTILSVNTLRINKVLAYTQRIRGFARAT